MSCFGGLPMCRAGRQWRPLNAALNRRKGLMPLLMPRRRSFLAGVTASLLPLPAIAAGKQATATIAMVTTSQGNGSEFLYMKRERLFEKYAAQFGYELQTRYLNFQTGPQITEG